MTTKFIFRHPTENLLAFKGRLLGICFVVLFSFLSSKLNSQVSTGYTFSNLTTPSHVAMAGGTTLATGTGASLNDAIYNSIPIGFTANFNGIDYTSVGVSTNGFIWFGSIAPAINEYNPISSATAMTGVASCFGANLVGKAAGSTLKYTTTGSCPNRVFMVQWFNMKVVGKSSQIDLQITITETSNNIELHPYDASYFVFDTYTAQVGLRGSSNTDYNNRSVISCTNNWNSSIAGASNAATCQIDGLTCSTYPGAPGGTTAAVSRYKFTNNSAVATTTWNGSVNSDWFTSANWSSGTIPSTYNNVSIPTGLPTYPILTGGTNANCKNLTLATGATLTTAVGYSATLTIAGNIASDGIITNSGTNYISVSSTSASTISGVGDYSAADLSLSGSCTSYSLSNNIALRKLTIGTGSTLSMNTFNLTICTTFTQTGTINQSTGILQIEDVAPSLTNATFNENTGTTYFANGINTSAANQTIPSITYYNLKVNTNNGYTSSIGNGSTVACNNLTIINTGAAGGIASAVNAITVSGNFDLAPSGNAPVVNLSNDITISGIMTLYLGIINTNTYKISMNNSSATSVVAGTGNTDYTFSYINGNLRRLILSATISNYDFPLGDATTSHYIKMIDSSLTGGGFSYIDGYFGALTNHLDVDMLATEPSEAGVTYDHVSTEGVWFLNPDNQPTSGLYNVQAYINGFVGLVDDEFSVLKRISASTTAADWSNGGASATRPSSMSLGRTVAGGYALRYGLTSFSQFGIGHAPIVPLPIELLTFNGTVLENENMLEWITATETSNDYFSIERSVDAANFTTILTVDGAGNSTQVLNYKAFDSEPLNGLAYYRLKQTDYNGVFSFSNIISLYRSQTDFELLNIYNSFQQGTLEATISCSGNCDIDIELFDISGKKVFTTTSKSLGNETQIVIPTANLNAGIYLFKAYNGNQLITRKIKL
jgi:hypothetical protein